jgi:prephenate dehydrogenase
MAGSHETGLDHAREDLFEGAACVVTRCGDARAMERIGDFWRDLGARVVIRDPQTHDAEVAWVSHLPHLVAFAFAGALESAPEGAGEVAGSGFRDFTRIARSDPGMWADILTGNRKAISTPLQKLGEALRELGRAVETGDSDAVERWIGSARAALSTVSTAQRGRPIRDSKEPAEAT